MLFERFAVRQQTMGGFRAFGSREMSFGLREGGLFHAFDSVLSHSCGNWTEEEGIFFLFLSTFILTRNLCPTFNWCGLFLFHLKITLSKLWHCNCRMEKKAVGRWVLFRMERNGSVVWGLCLYFAVIYCSNFFFGTRIVNWLVFDEKYANFGSIYCIFGQFHWYKIIFVKSGLKTKFY